MPRGRPSGRRNKPKSKKIIRISDKTMLQRRKYNRGIRTPKFYFKRTTSLFGLNTAGVSVGVTWTAPSTNVGLISATAQGAQYISLGYAFQLADVPNISEFTTLFDRYCLKGVSMKIYPFSNDPATGNTTANSGGLGVLIHSVIDYDDYTGPSANDAGLDVLKQYSSYKCVNMAQTKYFKRYFRPKTLVGAVNPAGALIGNRVVSSGFNDMANTSVPHMGLKLIIEVYNPTTATLTYAVKQECTYYFQCKDLR